MQVLNMKDLYSKEIMLYSIFDIRLQKPLNLKVILYTMFNILWWGIPAAIITGKLNMGITLWRGVLVFAVPWLLGQAMARPIFNGRDFLPNLIVFFKFFTHPKKYYDNKPSNMLPSFKIDEFYLISRRKDYQKLFDLKYSKKGGVRYV